MMFAIKFLFQSFLLICGHIIGFYFEDIDFEVSNTYSHVNRTKRETDVCVPFSEQACKDAVDSLGLQKGGRGFDFVGSHSSKGCYAYESGTFANMAYYGVDGTEDQMKVQLAAPKYRPFGYDCSTSDWMQEEKMFCKRCSAFHESFEDAKSACENEHSCEAVYDLFCDEVGSFCTCNVLSVIKQTHPKGMDCIHRKPRNP